MTNDTMNSNSETSYAIENEGLTGHSYDGIEEYDNPLPGWWTWLFVGTVLICPPYWAYYHFGTEGRSVTDRFEVELASNAKLQFAEIGELAGDRKTLVQYMNQKSWLSFGKSVFQTNCVSCHKSDGSGLVGPNLTDEQYKNVKQIEDVFTVIVQGAGGGAMPSWKNRLSQNEMVLVAAYAASLRGKPVGGTARPAEGNVIDPWPTVEEVSEESSATTESVPADTTKAEASL